eukprot:764186-Hanusia_phi.AAC.2
MRSVLGKALAGADGVSRACLLPGRSRGSDTEILSADATCRHGKSVGSTAGFDGTVPALTWRLQDPPWKSEGRKAIRHLEPTASASSSPGSLAPGKGPRSGPDGVSCSLLRFRAQAPLISRKYRCVHISTGDLLRAEMKIGSELGARAYEFIREGKLLPDQLVISIVKKRIAQARRARCFCCLPVLLL